MPVSLQQIKNFKKSLTYTYCYNLFNISMYWVLTVTSACFLLTTVKGKTFIQNTHPRPSHKRLVLKTCRWINRLNLHRWKDDCSKRYSLITSHRHTFRQNVPPLFSSRGEAFRLRNHLPANQRICYSVSFTVRPISSVQSPPHRPWKDEKQKLQLWITPLSLWTPHHLSALSICRGK